MTTTTKGKNRLVEDRLRLKQLQINSLLAITQAINKNIDAHELCQMYEKFLFEQLDVTYLVFAVKEESSWKILCECTPPGIQPKDLTKQMALYKNASAIKPDLSPDLIAFEYIVPVFHKEDPIAFAVLNLKEENHDDYESLQLIIATTNIIAVALENKRLFKKQIEQERLKKEMELASDVQEMLIPSKYPQGSFFEIDHIYLPHFNVGGDYIDFIKYSNDKFALCIADVTGKGVSAALVMANFQAILHNLAYQYRDLETLIFALNEAVFRITRGERYITFFIAEIDRENTRIKYLNAGHPPPFLCCDGKIHELSSGCTILGHFPKLPEIKEGKINLGKNNLLLVFTDGLYDLRAPDGSFFNEEMIKKSIGNNNQKSASEFNQILEKNMRQFIEGEEYPDDIAILTCKIDLNEKK